MTKKAPRNALGRGLSALISSTPEVPLRAFTKSQTAEKVIPIKQDAALHGLRYVSPSEISANPWQPRSHFSEEDLKSLASSIQQQGVLQPLIVREANGKLQLIAGERRLRAAKLCGIDEIPVLVRSISDRDALELAIVENVQRADLNPVEEARAYQRLADEFGLSQAEIAERVGKDRSSISNIVRILKLSSKVLNMVEEGKLSFGHARTLSSVKEEIAQYSLAKRCLSDNLSVRDLEDLVSRVIVLDAGSSSERARRSSKRNMKGDSKFTELEDQLRSRFGTKVLVKSLREGRGKIEVDFHSEDELQRVADLMLGS